MEDLAPVYPGGDTVQDLQVHQGHAEHVLSQEGGVGMEGAEEGGNTVRSMI